MKRMYILGALLWLCSFVTYAQENLFDRFSEMEGVTSVYVSKAMFSMMSDIKVDGLQLEGIGQKLESLQVLNSEKAPVIQKLREAVTGFTPKHGYESLVRVRDNGEKVDILYENSMTQQERRQLNTGAGTHPGGYQPVNRSLQEKSPEEAPGGTQ